MKNAISTLVGERDCARRNEQNERGKAQMYTESADQYAKQAAEYEAAIYLLEQAVKAEETGK